MIAFTPKQRMLNAYTGVFSDRYPVAPEFWFYYPAKILGVDMIELERKIPHWQALQKTFTKFGTEGWGVAGAPIHNPDVEISHSEEKLDSNRIRSISTSRYKGKKFVTTHVFDKFEPSWLETYPILDANDMQLFMDMSLSPNNIVDFEPAIKAYNSVGEDYLLELGIYWNFFDFFGFAMGFENAIMFFNSEKYSTLEYLHCKYIELVVELTRKLCVNTPFESLFVGCGYSCPSLIGPTMWRKWDKICLVAIAKEVHRNGKLLHIHLHGKNRDILHDISDMGIDCVCPFERSPGGDIDGFDGLMYVRKTLNGRVTVNGNINTVNTLIRGTVKQVQQEVDEVLTVFEGESRLIVGTGDQVGYETPEDNLYAMIDRVKQHQFVCRK